eukprot:TRINITY_DN29885_c0_g1_i1.p1 TRINITY_DN29885_c0_g1~~TRINITY_DN29885_c0_g1_i1.p1  ORF type:complete len:897 (+),score=182.68 TRINITY_DN29885_c0_g1_i1:127-2817(+)
MRPGYPATQGAPGPRAAQVFRPQTFRLPTPSWSPPPVEQENNAVDAAAAQRAVQLRFQRDQIRTFLHSHPEDSRAFLQLAELDLKLGDAEDCVRLAYHLCRQHPGVAWRSASRALLEGLQRPADTQQLLLEAQASPELTGPSKAEVCCQLARLRPLEAEHWYKQALHVDPHSLPGLLGAAEWCRGVNRHEKAAQLLKAAQQQKPLSMRHLFRFGEALVLSGQPRSGKEVLEQVLQQGNDTAYHVQAMATLALAFVLEEQHDQALQCCRLVENFCEQRLAAGPTGAHAEELRLVRFLEGVTLMRQGALDSAVECLHHAANMPTKGDSLDEKIQSMLCHTEVLRGSLSTAERHLSRAMTRGRSPETRATAAFLRMAQGQQAEAEEQLREALKADRSCSVVLLRMGRLLMLQGQLVIAVEFLQKCLLQPSSSPFFGSAERSSAHVYMSLAQHQRGLGVSGQAPSALGPRDSSTQEHLRQAQELLPQLRSTLFESTPSNSSGIRRLGLVDLSAEEVALLRNFCGALQDLHSVPNPAVGLPKMPGPTAPTLVGTASTAAPSSKSPSRQASDVALLAVADSSAAVPAAPSHAAAQPSELPEAPAQCGSINSVNFAELELGELLSRGELTMVHKGLFHGRGVVVKVLQQQASLDHPEAADDLMAEVRLVAELSHPCIVPLVGASLDPRNLAMVTELAPGGNLHQAIHVRKREYSREERFQLATELLQGVRYLHEREPPVVHLDLKSMNLVLDAEGTHLRICDFGLARTLGRIADDSSTSGCDGPTSRGGSPRYMAPECYDVGLGPLTEKTDVWSLGCILIEIFGCCQPYAECSNVHQILKIMLVSQIPPSIPADIEDNVRSIITSALRIEAKDRKAVDQVLLTVQIAASRSTDSKTGRLQWIP